MRILNNTIYFLADGLRKFGFNFNEELNPSIQKMRQAIKEIGGGIEFKIEQYPDGSWVAESVNIEGVITGSKNIKEISHLIKDAVFTYFNIPPYLCRDDLLKADNEPVTLRQKVYV